MSRFHTNATVLRDLFLAGILAAIICFLVSATVHGVRPPQRSAHSLIHPQSLAKTIAAPRLPAS
ncbi:hypothetical protein [Gloeobacter kilaueensis]|uniref:Uncharacterized protein n=1 Tax=Gloeobacter kilaueensis (strain ATCC BAA-2537 / CCAP 1431/1 / ULC 316 / JS1) TaxID=1183438 RepID=U5QP07_GLOK1|nr:hypothetical protein [Gloeobacter kilaueensis]AGY60681.1 hypothetical protein GKIL_4435 [Gloeobacter kilaueensis JS1]